MSRLISAAVLIGVAVSIYVLFSGDGMSPTDARDAKPEDSSMAQAGSLALESNTGFSYSPALAAKFGLPAGDATEMQSPLLGLAMEIKPGIRGGKVCLLHVLFDASADIRLPAERETHSIGPNVNLFPNGFLQRPDGDVRQFMAAQVGALSHRAMFRNGRSELVDAVTVGDDPDGSYTSMPLDGYHREFVPGVGWLAMSVNCELAAHDGYSHASLYVESNASPSDMIMNKHIDPARMIEFRFPPSFLPGMRAALTAAVDSMMEQDPQAPAERYSIIK